MEDHGFEKAVICEEGVVSCGSDVGRFGAVNDTYGDEPNRGGVFLQVGSEGQAATVLDVGCGRESLDEGAMLDDMSAILEERAAPVQAMASDLHFVFAMEREGSVGIWRCGDGMAYLLPPEGNEFLYQTPYSVDYSDAVARCLHGRPLLDLNLERTGIMRKIMKEMGVKGGEEARRFEKMIKPWLNERDVFNREELLNVFRFCHPGRHELPVEAYNLKPHVVSDVPDGTVVFLCNRGASWALGSREIYDSLLMRRDQLGQVASLIKIIVDQKRKIIERHGSGGVPLWDGKTVPLFPSRRGVNSFSLAWFTVGERLSGFLPGGSSIREAETCHLPLDDD